LRFSHTHGGSEVDRRLIPTIASVLTVLSCTRPSATPAPAAPAPASSAQTASAEPEVVAPRRVPPSRDSLSKLRAVFVAQVMQQIAGRENQPAEQVFKNVQVLKGLTAVQLVHKMDEDYGVALSWNCTNCHRFANQGNFASDTSNNKVRARFMQQMVNDINTNQLPKLYPRDTPRIDCATCHRGYNEPPSPEYLIPERGKPGGLPPFRPRGSPPRG
jgi:hypothetical protein